MGGGRENIWNNRRVIDNFASFEDGGSNSCFPGARAVTGIVAPPTTIDAISAIAVQRLILALLSGDICVRFEIFCNC